MIVDNRITMVRSVVNLHKGTVAGHQKLLAATKNVDGSVVEFSNWDDAHAGVLK